VMYKLIGTKVGSLEGVMCTQANFLTESEDKQAVIIFHRLEGVIVLVDFIKINGS